MTLYEQLGGHAAIVDLADALYDRVLSDPVVAPYFEGVNTTRLRAHQAAFLTVALGGPGTWTHRPLDAAHRDHGITNVAFDRVVYHLRAILRELVVPPAQQREILALIETTRKDIVTATAVID